MKTKNSVVLAIALAVCAAGAQTLVAERGVSLNAALEMATASLARVPSVEMGKRPQPGLGG